jgi:hypothetical protein
MRHEQTRACQRVVRVDGKCRMVMELYSVPRDRPHGLRTNNGFLGCWGPGSFTPYLGLNTVNIRNSLELSDDG